MKPEEKEDNKTMRPLDAQELSNVEGGVMPGGCLGPLLEKLLKFLGKVPDRLPGLRL